MTTRIYLDYAATAPLRDAARAAMQPWLAGAWNASSTHFEGRQAREALDRARDRFAECFSVRAREVYFTASGSEAVSLALLGAMRVLGPAGRIYTTPVEHRAVLAAATEMQALGWQHVLLEVDCDGLPDLAKFESQLRDAPQGTPLVLSMMLVNNELGTINDLAAFAHVARAHGAFVHCDAIGAGALVAVTPFIAHCDALSLAAHKFGGPLGAGVLIARPRFAFTPGVFGGGQEFGKRAGTENLAAIAGAAAAFVESERLRAADGRAVQAMRDDFEARITSAFDGVYAHAAKRPRAPGISNLAVPFAALEVLPAALDLAGIACSAGSACASGATKRSHVLEAIGYARGASIRFSWGAASTAAETSDAVRRFTETIQRMRTGSRSPLP